MTPIEKLSLFAERINLPTDDVMVLLELLIEERALVKEACAKKAEAMVERNRSCSAECRCADGWHIAAAIRGMEAPTP